MDGDIKRDDICFASEFLKFIERVPDWIQTQSDLSGNKCSRTIQETDDFTKDRV